MRFTSITEIKDGQPLHEADLEEREWKRLATGKLTRAWQGEEDALYDYLD